MKTVIVGGGKGCRAIIGLAFGKFLKELTLNIIAVADVDPDAPGMDYARDHGIATYTDVEKAIGIPGVELIIELTGSDVVLEDIYGILPHGVKVIDHVSARIFWDLTNAQEESERQLQEMTKLERRVERERLFLQGLFDTIPDLVVVLSRDGRIIRANERFAEFVGLSSAETVGKTCEQLFENTPFSSQSHESYLKVDHVFETGKPHTVIWRTNKPSEAYWEVTRTPIVGRDNEVAAVLGTWHRITERVRLRREIESAELRFKSFIDSARDWISIKDLEGKYVIVNPVVAHAFGLEPEAFVGKRPEEILPVQIARIITRHDREVIDTDKYHTYDEIFQIEGRDRYFQTVRFPLTDYKGSTIGSCTIARDVTAESELRSQLAKAEKLAAVGKLAAGVAHEINNPLTGVLAFAEDLLDEVPEDSEFVEDIQVIIREALRCRDIVRNLLDFARQENPKFEIDDINTVVQQSLILVERLPQFRNVTIGKCMGEGLPSIRCDPDQIKQVILNLMLNAADAVDGRGTIGISTGYEKRNDKCVISVEDDGPGIPENLIDKIFEPFFSTKGTNGLGLAVSWGIIERHGGVIEIDIAESGGAIFRIVLPAFRR
jgi:two-component system NtrC family sensor kinase